MNQGATAEEILILDTEEAAVTVDSKAVGTEAAVTVDSKAVGTEAYMNTIKDSWMPQDLGESYLLDTDTDKQFATLESVQKGPPPAYLSTTPSELDYKDSEQVSKADTTYTLSQEPTEELLQPLD